MIWVWIGALLIGLTLGLLGSGGSILTVPVLVYIVGEPDKVAIAESLGIVALISLVGMIPFIARRTVDWRSVRLFGIPGMIASYGGAYLAAFLTGAVQLVLFAGVMLAAAVMMYRGTARTATSGMPFHASWKIVAEGLFVGLLTGLVGVGGGFLIVPALVLLVGLPMHVAVGTSLAIIALKSISGFYKYIDVLAELGQSVDWRLILLFSMIGIAGSFLGKLVGEYVSQDRLKKAFAAFLLVAGVGILWQNTAALVPGGSARDVSVDGLPESRRDDMFGFFRKSTGEPYRLSAEDFFARRAPGDIVIDVRTESEYRARHVAGAGHVDFKAPGFREQLQRLDPEGTYYLYCRTGNRSGTAAKMMRDMGYERVFNVGGLDSLARAGVDMEE